MASSEGGRGADRSGADRSGADRSGADRASADRAREADRTREAERRSRSAAEARTAGKPAESPPDHATFDAGQRQLAGTGAEAKQRVEAGIRDAWDRQRAASASAPTGPSAATVATGTALQAATGQAPPTAAAPASPLATSVPPSPAQPTAQLTQAQFAPVSPMQPQQPFRGQAGFGVGVGIAVGAGLTALTPQGQAVLEEIGLLNVVELSRTPKIQRAAQHLGVNPATVEGLLAAKAYQDVIDSSRDLGAAKALQRQTGLNYDPAKVVQNGPHLNALAETVARIEYDHPGTWDALTTRERQSTIRQAAAANVQPQIDTSLKAVDMGLISSAPGALIGPGLLEARIGIHPALTTYSRRARNLAFATAMPVNPQNWRAHHVVPFESIYKMDPTAQLALAGAGWRMDSPGNLIALPGDSVTYEAPPNSQRRPYHSGPHRNYTAAVNKQLATIRNSHAVLSADALRLEMLRATRSALDLLDDDRMHPRLN